MEVQAGIPFRSMSYIDMLFWNHSTRARATRPDGGAAEIGEQGPDQGEGGLFPRDRLADAGRGA